MKKTVWLLLPLLSLIGCHRGEKASPEDAFALFDKAALRSSEKTALQITTSTPLSLSGSYGGYPLTVNELPLDIRIDGSSFSFTTGLGDEQGSFSLSLPGMPMGINGLAFGMYGDGQSLYLDCSDSSLSPFWLLLNTALDTTVPRKIVMPLGETGMEVEVGSMFASLSAEPYRDFRSDHADCFKFSKSGFTLNIDNVDDLLDYFSSNAEIGAGSEDLGSIGDILGQTEAAFANATINEYTERWRYDENGFLGFEAVIDVEGLDQTANSNGGEAFLEFGFEFAYDGFEVESPEDKGSYEQFDLSGVIPPATTF